MPNITVTYGTEVASGLITATKWNTNLADLVNGLSDGTKDITVANVNASGITANTITAGIVTAPSMGTTLANAVFQTFQRSTGTSVTTPNIAISNSSSGFTTSSTSLTDVTNLSVTLTTTGRPVLVGVVPDGSTNDSYVGHSRPGTTDVRMTLAILRDATKIGASLVTLQNNTTSASAIYIPPSFILLDVVAAGTYVYKAQASVYLSGTASVVYCRLVAFEL